MSVICIEHLTRDYGSGKGIFDISFDVGKGEVFGFLGPNGAGKTTTIRHLMGFIRSKSGKCSVKGMDCWKESSRVQRMLGYIPGEITFFDDMTGSEYLHFIARFRNATRYRGVDKREICNLAQVEKKQQELLEYFEFDPKGKIKKMSKGMKQKLGIVSAFMNDPEILILDEPTSGLDPLMQNRFIDLVEKEKQRGKTILMSSHMFEEVERTCDRIGIIRDGRLVAIDSVEALRQRHIRSYCVTLKSEKEAQEFAKDFDGVIGDSVGSVNKCTVTVCAKQRLEDIFMHYYGEDNNE